MGSPYRRSSRLAWFRRSGLSRRDFLLRAGTAVAAVGLAPLLPACGNSTAPGDSAIGAGPGVSSPFKHGIATGDPLPNAVIFWTRVTPESAAEEIAVVLRVYQDPQLTQLFGSIPATANSLRDWTVKIDFAGLLPASSYYYQFEAKGFKSAIGRTRTAPSGTVSRLRLGLVSCSSYAHGFFNAYGHLSKRADLDAIVHLGDYIYEYASDAASGDEVYGSARPYEPSYEMKTLADYRTRHAYYKRTDPELVELHRQFPFITIWDDHESCDNSWRDGGLNHNEGGKNEGVWSDRKSFSQRAYDEWMPIRLPVPGDSNRIWRKLSYGSLAELILLDTRLFDRDLQLSTPIQPQENTTDAAKKMIGPVQRQFLIDSIKNSTATWKLVGSQVVFHQWSLSPGLKSAGGPRGLNGDSWDAYGFERQQIIDALRANAAKNVVILTGDVHSSWVADITDDPNNPAAYSNNPVDNSGSGSVAAEFVVTSITSPVQAQLAMLDPAIDGFRANNPHIKYIDLLNKGYSILDVTPERVLCEYWYVSTIATRGGTESFATAFPVPVDANRVRAAVTAASTAPANPPPLAP